MISNLKSVEENKEYLKSVIGVDKGGNRIDWKNSISKKIKYEYNCNKEYSKGLLKISEYDPKSQKVYFEGYSKGIRTSDLMKCKISGILNIIWYKAPWMINLGVLVEDAKKYTTGSAEKIEVKCPYCGRTKKVTPHNVYRQHSIGCSCGDGISYPEKLMENVLIQLGIEYERQYKPNWSENKIYDFYLPDANTIIEAHGVQHYEETTRGRSLKEEQENDRSKEELALNNGIKYYMIIDCRKSELEYIKNNILNSKLNEILDLNNIDWAKCEEYALKNKVKEVCDYYNEHPGIFTTDLVKEFGIDRTTIAKYLKSGTKLGWCKYDSKEAMRYNAKFTGKHNSKPISQFTLEGEFIKTYPSAAEIERQTGIGNSNISACCRGKQKSAGGFIWRFAE